MFPDYVKHGGRVYKRSNNKRTNFITGKEEYKYTVDEYTLIPLIPVWLTLEKAKELEY